MKLKKMAQGRSGGGYRVTGERRLNKAGGSNPRTGKAFETIEDEAGRVGHRYDGGEVVWISPRKGLKAPAVRGSAQSQFQQDVSKVPPRNLVELLDQLKVNGRRTRSF